MTFGQAIGSVFNNYANFTGRACRAEYWYFVLLTFLVNGALQILAHTDPQEADLINALWGLATIVPTLSVSVRRLHDIGRSGWWLLLGCIPVAGWIVLLIWHARPGDAWPNRYGRSPLAFSSDVP
jgi:uncharacterized membrane protein YhaH (DUF805 family)